MASSLKGANGKPLVRAARASAQQPPGRVPPGIVVATPAGLLSATQGGGFWTSRGLLAGCACLPPHFFAPSGPLSPSLYSHLSHPWGPSCQHMILPTVQCPQAEGARIGGFWTLLEVELAGCACLSPQVVSQPHGPSCHCQVLCSPAPLGRATLRLGAVEYLGAWVQGVHAFLLTCAPMCKMELVDNVAPTCIGTSCLLHERGTRAENKAAPEILCLRSMQTNSSSACMPHLLCTRQTWGCCTGCATSCWTSATCC